ncbi:MAG TPA: 4-hydroxy-3-methylbut-2-enyl diphosphate reductase [Prolixibacteraceae bacterium]|nr:4-hydroxy-3-methylbut-2-enyl diphosphate reductase [Prolixibacteraceae bacterium]
MIIEIDRKSGFCFGVTNAIGQAEEELAKQGQLYCLGDIVHNDAEIDRLRDSGLVTISREQFFTLQNCRVLIRAHGEPPETYQHARKNNITLIDATCPVVIKLQQRVKTAYRQLRQEKGQLVIFGKMGHAETEGLNGQVGNRAIIVQNKEELDIIDFERPIELFSQTTMSVAALQEVAGIINRKASDPEKVKIHDTICRQVANRGPHLRVFAGRFDVVIFVSGKKSSNGAALFQICREANPNSHFVEGPAGLEAKWFDGAASTGICGATSTPMWLMEATAREIERLIRE